MDTWPGTTGRQEDLVPSPELRVEDAGGVKAAKPVFLSLSLLFATPNKRLKFFQQKLQIMEIPIPGGAGGAELQGRGFEWCVDRDTRQVHCRRARPRQPDNFSTR